MIFNDIIVFLTSITTVIAGGGWFVNYKLNKRQKTIETANLQMDFYVKRIEDVESRLLTAYNKILELEKRCETCLYRINYDKKDNI
jgi:hypothetical protein